MKLFTCPANIQIPKGLLTYGNQDVTEFTFAQFFSQFLVRCFPISNASQTAALVGACGKLKEIREHEARALTDTEQECLCTAVQVCRDRMNPDFLMYVPNFFHSVMSASPITEEQALALVKEKKNGVTAEAVS